MDFVKLTSDDVNGIKEMSEMATAILREHYDPIIGKEQNGYRCGGCGAFMDSPMDSFTEIQVNGAIRDAESGRSRALYDYYKAQYPNIQANIPRQITEAEPVSAALPTVAPALLLKSDGGKSE